MIIFTDDELDCRELKDEHGNPVVMKSIIEKLNRIYTSYLVVISRKPPTKAPDTIFEGANTLFLQFNTFELGAPRVIIM